MPSAVASGPPLHPPLLNTALGRSAVSHPYVPLLAKSPPPELTKSAIFSALVVKIASVVDERLQLSGIQIIVGVAELIVVEKKELIEASVV